MRRWVQSGGIGVTLTLGALLCSARADAQTLVDGGEIDDETWTASRSPYLVNGDVIVPPGKVLIIEAGTTVVVGSSDLSASGASETLVEIRVQGELYVNGTLSAPVTIANEEASSQDSWYGIRLEPEATHARLIYSRIANGSRCLESSAPPQALEVVATTFATCDTGAFLDGGAARFDRVLVQNSGFGLWLQNAATQTFENLIVRENDTGLYVLSSSLSLENVTFTQNTVGIAAGSQRGVPANITLTNSIFADNTPPFKLGSNVLLSLAYSDVWPAAAASSRIALGPGVLALDPSFVAPPADLHLAATSACIDAGDTATSSDHDFDRNARPLDGNDDGTLLPDLGAYELFHRALCGDGHVDAGEVCDDGDANGIFGFCSEDCRARPGGAAGGAGFGGSTGSGGTQTDTAGRSSGGESAATEAGTDGDGGSADAAARGGATGTGATAGGTRANAGEANAGETTGPARSGSAGADLHPPAGAGGSAGRTSRDEPPSRSGGEAGAAGEAPRTVPVCTRGVHATCACPDRSPGTLACEPDGTWVCYCSGVASPPPSESGCGCNVERGKTGFAAWFGLFAALGVLNRRRLARQTQRRS